MNYVQVKKRLLQLIGGLLVGVLSGSPAVAVIQFQEVTGAAGISDGEETWGSAITDIDGNGFPDVWLNKHQYIPTVIYINNTDGTFTRFDEPGPPGPILLSGFEPRTDTHGIASADWDNDGDQDVLEEAIFGEHLVWENNGLGMFNEIRVNIGLVYPLGCDIEFPDIGCNPIGARAPMFFDYDVDGDLDVMLTARRNLVFYQSPSFTFEQIQQQGQPFFQPDASTGVNYQGDYDCAFGILADVSGDDSLDVICSELGAVRAVLDTTPAQVGQPFADLRPQIGEDLYNTFPTDLIGGDFNNDGLTDLFGVVEAVVGTVMEQIDGQTIHAKFSAGGPEVGFNFQANGSVTFEFDWWTSVDQVHLGAGGQNPPVSVDPGIINGTGNAPHHITMVLDPNDPNNSGLAGNRTSGFYIGLVGNQWQVRVVNLPAFQPGVVVTAQSIFAVSSVGPITVGAPANRQALLFMQNAQGQLIDSRNQVQNVPSSCVSVACGDFDNDGDQDCITGCATALSNLPNILYENDGNANFTAVPQSGGAEGQMPLGRADQVMILDYDIDGRLDLFFTNGAYSRPFSYAGIQQLYRNVSNNPGNNWIKVILEGTASNSDAIGSVVYATTPNDATQKLEQGNGMHLNAQNERTLHFGLGPQNQVSLRVVWPNGVEQTHDNLGVNQICTLVEGNPNPVCVPPPDGGPPPGGIDPCGEPQFVPGAMHLWEDCNGGGNRAFSVRTTGDGTTNADTYSGNLATLGGTAFSNVGGELSSLEANDVLVQPGADLIQYSLNVQQVWFDQFGFTFQGGDNVCFGLDLPPGTPVQVGQQGSLVSAPFDLTDFEDCDIGVEPTPDALCGSPQQFNAGAVHLWEDCPATGGVRSFSLRAMGESPSAAVTFDGTFDSLTGQTFSDVAAELSSLEAGDVLEVLNGGTQVHFELTAFAPWWDQFGLSFPVAADVCIGLNLPPGTPVSIGDQGTEVVTPFSLSDLQPCVVP